MIFSRKGASSAGAYPEVPSSLRSDSVELAGVRRFPQGRADTAPHITPYLSLRARLSQIWINRWTILLALVLVRVVLLIAQLHDNIGDAKTKALSACTKVEDIGSSMASMPHYLSLGVNELAATGITKAVHAMVDVLDLMLQGVEGIIIFFINFMTATYVCLLTAMVHGSLEVVSSVVEDSTKAFNDIIDKATDEIQDIAGDLEKGINKIVNGIEDSFLGGVLPDIPDVDFDKPIKELKDFDLDTDGFVKDVRQLNKDLPTFDEVQNITKEAISIPFDLVRKALNDSYGGYTFDRDVFPLAQKEKLTFCSENDSLNNFFNNLYELVHDARIAFCTVIAVLAVAAIIPMAWLEIRRWRRQQRYARLVEQNHYDPMDVVYIASRPLTAGAGIKAASAFSDKRQILVRWCFAYATSTPAIFVLSLAIAGFFSCLCQYILLKVVQKEVPALAQEVGKFADDVVDTLQSVSTQWAVDANGVIKDTQGDINNDVLGYVTNATDAVNDTLTTFLHEMDSGLNTAFNGTILLDPIKTVLHCVIGIKIESVQHGLTWVHDHAHVNLPLFDNNTFSLGANESVGGDSDLQTFLATPQSATTDEVTGAVKHVTDWLHDNLIQEALISTGILLVYVIVVLLGVARTLAAMAAPDRGRAEGGSRFTGDERPPLTPRSQQMREHEAASGVFPRFGSHSTEPELSRQDGDRHGEKVMTSPVSQRARHMPGHKRSSSYGYFDHTDKF